MGLLELRDNGLYCSSGDFFIDPWGPADRAVITHAHADHASAGSRAYLIEQSGKALLREHLGPEATIETAAYGQGVTMGDIRLSFHPAGHILGSAQVRLERAGEVWVISGDYKLVPDPTCAAFERLRCHTFVTEATFGLPVFRWPDPDRAMDGLHSWWRGNQDAGKPSLLFAHPLGKAQRVLAMLDRSIGPVYAHPAVERINRIYRECGVLLPPVPSPSVPGAEFARALILAPPACRGTPWARRFGPASTGMVSGWMRIRGARRRRSLDRGFVISDHADWPSLLRAIDETGAETVWVTHGYRAPLVRWLLEHGRHALSVETRFEGEIEQSPEGCPE